MDRQPAQLPARPNLDHLRGQAKALLAQLKQGNAGAARARRSRLAQVLDRIERALPAPPPAPAVSERPPWSLWHDPGAQAAYAAAEWLADAIERSIGATPAPGALAAALAAWSAPIDRLGTATCAI